MILKQTVALSVVLLLSGTMQPMQVFRQGMQHAKHSTHIPVNYKIAQKYYTPNRRSTDLGKNPLNNCACEQQESKGSQPLAAFIPVGIAAGFIMQITGVAIDNEMLMIGGTGVGLVSAICIFYPGSKK